MDIMLSLGPVADPESEVVRSVVIAKQRLHRLQALQHGGVIDGAMIQNLPGAILRALCHLSTPGPRAMAASPSASLATLMTILLVSR